LPKFLKIEHWLKERRYKEQEWLGLSPCSCICHNATNAFRHRHTLVSSQYKVSLSQPRVNLDQKHFWVIWGKLLGDQNWTRFGCCKLCGDQNISITKPTPTEKFQLPILQQQKNSIANHVMTKIAILWQQNVVFNR
jgi:hypothetical protein